VAVPLKAWEGARAGNATTPSAAVGKTGSVFFPAGLIARARTNAEQGAWARAIRDSLVAAAKPWRERSDEELWALMFGNALHRAWQVWSNGHCPACRRPVPMYEWVPDALNRPWKMQCPRCRELFPKNDFLAFYQSGLNEQAVFDPARAARSLLFNVEHPETSDPLHRFGVDDGEGYLEGTNRWRFIGAYLIFGQWKQAVVGGIRNLAAAYAATGDLVYSHKAGVLLDRVADLYPTFDFGKEGVMYEGPPRAGYVSTWHDACVEVQDLALAYDAVFSGLAQDTELVRFLAVRAARHRLANAKASFGDIQRNIEGRVFRDTLAHRPKIESNYPATDITIATLQTVLGWPANRAEVSALLDAIIAKATAVDGVTGEKGIAGYSAIAPRTIAEFLGRYARSEPGFLRETLRRHPRLHGLYRFHLDTWCLGQYYPRTGDTGSFAEKTPAYAGLAFTRNPGANPSSYSFLWALYEATGDKDFVRLLYEANGAASAGLPHDLFAEDPASFQDQVTNLMGEQGAAIRLRSVNKTEWGLAVLRAGDGPKARAAWLDYDSGERHGHADALTLGLFARNLDLLPDFGYPPVQYGGWSSPRAVWYTQTAAHNTVLVDERNSRTGTGKTTLWFDGAQVRLVRASAPDLIAGQQYERTIALVDLSDSDAYLIDVFRVVGGTNHTRILHGHFGSATTHGLTLAPVAEPHAGAQRRAFRRDPGPPEGWSVDWSAEDRFKYLPPGADVHLRHTDLTRQAEVELAETWVSTAGFGGTAEAWVPTTLVRRRAPQAPLASTFVAVLEPYEKTPTLAGVRRLALQTSAAQPCPDDCVGIEIRRADGGTDVFLANNVEAPALPDRPRPATWAIIEPGRGLRFEGDLCFLRFDRAGRPQGAMLCRSQFLRVGEFHFRAKAATASLELDLTRREAPVVAGDTNDVELVALAGETLWPK
jgi:hypothetical protein